MRLSNCDCRVIMSWQRGHSISCSTDKFSLIAAVPSASFTSPRSASILVFFFAIAGANTHRCIITEPQRERPCYFVLVVTIELMGHQDLREVFAGTHSGCSGSPCECAQNEHHIFMTTKKGVIC